MSTITVAWFRPEEWSELKRLCPDLHDTYEEWLTNAEAGIEALGSPLKEQVVKIVLTVDDLEEWQRDTGREIDSAVRAELAMKGGSKNARASH